MMDALPTDTTSPFSMESLRGFIDAAHAAPSADNTQPWRCEFEGGALHIRHDGRLSSPMAAADAHMSQLALGAMLENLHQYAAASGTCLNAVEGPNGRTLRVEGNGFATGAKEDHPLFSRHTNRHPYRRTALPAALLAEVGAMEEGTARVLVRENRTDVRFLAEQVRITSIARFRTRALHEWLMGSLRWNATQAASGEGLDVRTLHLPPGGRSLLRFLTPWRRMKWFAAIGGHRLLARAEAYAFSSAGAALAIVARRDAPVAAGRLLQRVWIRLHARGVAVHPFYVVSDQHERLSRGEVPPSCVSMVTRSERRCADALSIAPEERLQMLLRIGLPTRETVRSRRLPRGTRT